MPSKTFLNLPAEKQKKLLNAATREFSEYPFNEVSINRIIKAAGIPRGSFYMYFEGKEDLFRYLYRQHVDQLLAFVEHLLQQENGDVFTTLMKLFDSIHIHREGSGLGQAQIIFGIINTNSGLQANGLWELINPETVLDRMVPSVNAQLLDLQKPDDLRNILRILLGISTPIIYREMRGESCPHTRENYQNMLEILRRGMGSKRPAANAK